MVDKVVGELKPEDIMSIDSEFKQDEGTENKEYGKIDDTDQKPEDKVTSVITSKQEDGIDNNELVKNDDDTDQKPEEKVVSFKMSKEEDGIDNKESDKIDDTDQKPEDKVTSVITSQQEDGIDNKESDKNNETDKKLENIITSDKTFHQEDGTDKKAPRKIDAELKSEDKICIDNKSKIEDGPSLPLKMNHIEFSESSAILSLKNENEELGGSSAKHSLKDETYVYNKADSEDGLPLTTAEEKHSGEMSLCLPSTSELTVNSRKRNQNHKECLGDNENRLKKIKVEDTRSLVSDQFHEIWNNLQQDFSNFSLWENILRLVDEQNIEINARMAYSKFLELYPLCYGYWKKYANFEKRNGNIHEFENVLENGLRAIPISVDLWIYYMTYLRTERYDNVAHIRREFERSLKMCGLDYHSDQLWHDYISWEMDKNEIKNVTNIYYRLIRIPNSNYKKNFFKFQEFVYKELPVACLGFREYFEQINEIIQSSITNYSLLTSRLNNNDSIPPGEDDQQELTEASVKSIIRVKIIDVWYNVHKQTAIEFENRKIFEENIQRSYFHVNELESTQIMNWEKYIKFERKAGDRERIIYLYERCLIVCVSEERFWSDYIDYLSSADFEATFLLCDVFKRALNYHPNSLQLNLKYFDFSETHAQIETAEETITKLVNIYPDSSDVATRIINLSRKKHDGTVRNLFQYYLNRSQSKSFSSYLAVKYARFVWKHDRRLDLAFNILSDTIRVKNISVNDSLEIYLTLVDLKMELNPNNHLSVLKTIDDIILQCNSYNEKLIFSKKKIEYIGDYTEDYNMLRLAKIKLKNLKRSRFTARKQNILSITEGPGTEIQNTGILTGTY